MQFKVQSPDGRIITLEGETAPTEQELDEIFASLPEKEEKSTLSQEEVNKRAMELNPGIYNEDGSLKSDWVESGYIRKPMAVVKGLANASLNPVGIMTKGLNYSLGSGKYELPESLQGFKAETPLEKGLQRGTEQAEDFFALTGAGNALGAKGILGGGLVKGAGAGALIKSLPSATAKALLTGNKTRLAASGFSGGLLSGAVDSKNPYVDSALNILGATATDSLVSGIKSIGTAVKASKLKQSPTTYAKAVVDPVKYTKIKKGIQSGDRGLQEQAQSFAAALNERKDAIKRGYRPEEIGMAEFENQVKLPQMKVAQKNYAEYMSKNGDKLLPKKDVAAFYKNNPVARGLVEEARKTNPTQWKNIGRGTIKEADKLKQMLSRAKGATADIRGIPEKEAAATAENSIKSLMDKAGAGFRKVNSDFAKASSKQERFIHRLTLNAENLAKVQPSQFWSGLSTPLASAGFVGGFFNPSSWAATGAGLAGKALWRASNRQAGRAATKGFKSLGEMLKEGSLKSLGRGVKSEVYKQATQGEE